MQPKEISLSDTLRQRLDAQFEAVSQLRVPDTERDSILAGIVKAEIFDKATDHDALGNECAQLLATIIGMSTGQDAPAIYIKNLPEFGLYFTYGLMKNILPDTADDLRKIPIEGNRTAHLRFHQERAFSPGLRKTLTAIHCINQGSEPRPTIFVTTDEIIHAMACADLQLEPTITPAQAAAQNAQYASVHAQHVAALKQLQVQVPQEDGSVAPYPFLYENQSPALAAPRYFVTSPNVNKLSASFPDPKDEALYRKFFAAGESLREQATLDSYASVVPNTVVLWSDHWVHHAPGMIRPDVETSRGVRVLRNVEVQLTPGIGTPDDLATRGIMANLLPKPMIDAQLASYRGQLSASPQPNVTRAG